MTIAAERCGGVWTVSDEAGGRWWPDAAARLEIAASDDPAATAIAICASEPTRGRWHS